MGKYEPLGAFLSNQAKDHIPITFAEIEDILGTQLPASKQYPAWWSNNTGNNVMTQQWLDAGYQTESVNTTSGKLVFRRFKTVANGDSSASKPAESIDNSKQSVSTRSPIFGCMEGTVTIPDGVDLTDPSLPEWEQYAEEKYGKK